MKVAHVSTGALPTIVAAILASTSSLIVASPVQSSGLLTDGCTTPDPFLDCSTWNPNSQLFNNDPSTWVINIPSSSQDISTADPILLKKRHDYAMVCAERREHTEYCQRSPREYYCSQNGYVVQRSTATVRYTPCEDQCVCLGVALKPICLVGWSGSSTCLRSLPETAAIESMDVKPQSTIDYREVTGNKEIEVHRGTELVNRAAELESAIMSVLHDSSDTTLGAVNPSIPDTNAYLDSWSSNSDSIMPRQEGGATDGWSMFCNDRVDTVLCGDRGGYQCDSSGTLKKCLPDAPRYEWCETRCVCINP